MAKFMCTGQKLFSSDTLVPVQLDQSPQQILGTLTALRTITPLIKECDDNDIGEVRHVQTGAIRVNPQISVTIDQLLQVRTESDKFLALILFSSVKFFSFTKFCCITFVILIIPLRHARWKLYRRFYKIYQYV